jgi:hypothetical protein
MSEAKPGKLKAGDIVEHNDREGMLTVKMVQGDEVVVSSETMHLGVYNRDKLFLIPGQDYNYLRRIVVDTMNAVGNEIGRSNLSSDRGALAVTRRLYAAGVRRSEEDLVNHVRQAITLTISGCVSSEAVQDMIRANRHRVRDVGTGHPLFTPAPGTEADVEPVIEPEQKDPATVLQHTDLTGHSETLVQQLNDDELALMCCDVADMLANAMGFTSGTSAHSKKPLNLSSLQHRITYWGEPRGNVRKTQVWEMAKKVVAHCRMAEVEDAVENVFEAIRQQEDPEDDL